MKKGLAFLLLIVIAGTGVWLFSRSKTPQVAPGVEQGETGSSASANLPPAQGTVAAGSSRTIAGGGEPQVTNSAVPPLPPVAALNSPYVQELTAPDPSAPRPVTLMENMRTAIRNYGSAFGGNPVGNNAEITRALNGGNPRQVNFINPDAGLHLNGNGELVDSWGTPFFFHQLSAHEMEIRSAGPDRKMFTADDLLIK